MLQRFHIDLLKRSPLELEIVLSMYFNGIEAKEVTMFDLWHGQVDAILQRYSSEGG